MQEYRDTDRRVIEDVHSIKPRELRRDALGVLSTSAMTAAYMGPALSIYALFGPMTEKVGMGVGFVLLIAMVVTLLSAVSFGMLAKEMPSAGGLYNWSCTALGNSLGMFIGINTIIYYLICLIFAPIIFGQFFNEVLEQLGVVIEPDSAFWFWSWLFGAALMLVIAAFVTYRGIVVSAHLAFTLLMIELAVVIALAGTFIVLAIYQGTFTLAPVTFNGCQDGWRGIFLALPMGLMCMVCDAAIPASEETRDARRTIPIAVILTCFIVGIWYVVGFSAFAMARTSADISVSSIQNGIAPMAARVWGSWKILVSLTAMSAALGAFVPIITASSRMVFALAREGKLPARFANLHPKFLAPWNAIHLSFGFALIGVIPAVFFWGPNATIDWWSFTAAWFIGIVYVAANVVNIVYYWRLARSRFHPILNLLIPLLAVVVQIWVIYQSAIVSLWEKGALGRSAQLFMMLSTVAAICYSLYIKNRSFADRSLIQCEPPTGQSTLPRDEAAKEFERTAHGQS